MFENLPPIFLKFVRFTTVGGLGLVIDFGLTYWCKEKLNINKYMANGIGFFAAATNNFFINRYWTFESHHPDITGQYLKFISFAVIGLVINSVIVWWLNEHLKKNFYLSKAIATIIVTGWNFIANFLFTFK
ncbi:MAG: GtrA family protein [Flammeovirgaceae bacterium]